MNIGSQVLSDVIVYSKYAKYIPELQRRETWLEIVERYKSMMVKKYPQLEKDIKEGIGFIKDRKVLPSMRALQFAGAAIERAPSRIYNCCYFPVDSIHSFSEAMFLLLGGTGIGYSVQFHHIDKLPEVTVPTRTRRYLIGDSIEGWADSIKVLMKAYLGRGPLPIFDFRDIRHKGARLVTAGGKAPGPEPLKECLFQIQKILERKKSGDKLSSIECHDILCYIANAVLAGGIRRAAMIALFSFDDEGMINCKSSSVKSMLLKSTQIDEETYEVVVQQDNFVKVGRASKWDMEQYEKDGTFGWWVINEQRGRANNSAVIMRSRAKEEEFLELWKKIELSGSGEPGFYLTNNADWGTNPCCEIGLRPYQFCNLCEVNVSDIEDEADLSNRVSVAAFFGTLQAGFTDFHYLRPIWKKTTEKDALLGIGMTGIASGEILKYNLTKMAALAMKVNAYIAKQIEINVAARVTCVKPSGTTSCVLGTSSGIHAWHDHYYLRTIRFNRNEDIASYLIVNHPELVEDDILREDTICVRIPIEAPKGAIMRSESAIDLLERVKKLSTEWVKAGHRYGDNTHNVSATVSIGDDWAYTETSAWTKGLKPRPDGLYREWDVVGQWMWQNRDVYNGLSILPYDGGSYSQAPFESITKEEYEQRVKHLRNIDLTKVIELDDATDLKGEAACAGGACELK